jgi:DNA-binding SARP family transcriptional activator
MGLRFGLLGPLQAHNDGAELFLGAPKERALLTALLLRPNQTIPLHRLIAAVWDEDPPTSAVANLRTYVNRLRRQFPETSRCPSAQRFVARHPGYMLRVCVDELDTQIFAEHHERGREALQRDRFRFAVAELEAGLALWRGGAAEDIPLTLELEPGLDALDEQRWLARDALAEARLMLGAGPELVAELRTHLAEQPVRERLWACLMVALYRAGDTAAALDAYRTAQHALSEHLGIDPGAQLAELQRQILDRSADLTLPHPLFAAPAPL